MNLDPVPPVRPLLTHVIPGELVQREAGISEHMNPGMPMKINCCMLICFFMCDDSMSYAINFTVAWNMW